MARYRQRPGQDATPSPEADIAETAAAVFGARVKPQLDFNDPDIWTPLN
jgi:hypothetical protein